MIATSPDLVTPFASEVANRKLAGENEPARNAELMIACLALKKLAGGVRNGSWLG